MTVLITGAGLVGAQIASLEQQAGRTPVLFDFAPRTDALADFVDLDRCHLVRGDILNPLAIVEAINRHKVTRIIHTAAFGGLTAGARIFPLPTVQVNIVGTANILEAARVLGLERVVLCSSSAIYTYKGGQDGGAPGREEAYPRPSTIYATTKQAMEDLGLNYAAEFGLDVLAVRFASVFGPWRAGGGGILSVAAETWLRAALAGEPISIPPTRLEWVYSKDAAQGAFLACHVEKPKDRVFNIGMGVASGGPEIAAAIEGAAPGAKVTVEDNPPKGAVIVDMKAMDPARAREQLGYRAAFQMPEAMADYCAWLSREGKPLTERRTG